MEGCLGNQVSGRGAWHWAEQVGDAALGSGAQRGWESLWHGESLGHGESCEGRGLRGRAQPGRAAGEAAPSPAGPGAALEVGVGCGGLSGAMGAKHFEPRPETADICLSRLWRPDVQNQGPLGRSF